MLAILNLEDYTQIKIYKVKDYVIYFSYSGSRYMIRHIEDCGDHWNELTNKTTWEARCSDYTLFRLQNFLKPKYGEYYREGMPYSHLDVNYFAKCLNAQFKLNIEVD